MINIVLLDDHALVRDGVSRLLEASVDMKVVGSFGEVERFLKFAASAKPDVAIIDIAMPNANGIDVTRELRQSTPETQVLMLSMHSNPEYVYQALLAGALGYVAKESAGQTLVDAVRAVNLGRRYLSRELGNDALHRLQESAGKPDPFTLLTPRENQVLRHTVNGRTIAETAKKLGISTKSVETYRSRMMTKLSIDGVPALVKFAIRRGIISAD